MNKEQNFDNPQHQQLNIADVNGWHLFDLENYNEMPNEGQFIEVEYDDNTTVKFNWNINQIIGQEFMYMRRWRACR